MDSLIFAIVIMVIGVLITRAFGAWMLRINDVISEQKKTNELLLQILNKTK